MKMRLLPVAGIILFSSIVNSNQNYNKLKGKLFLIKVLKKGENFFTFKGKKFNNSTCGL